MKKTLFIFSVLTCLVFAFSSCKKKTTEIPADIFKQDTMISIMVDVQIAEAAILQKENSGIVGGDYSISYYKYIFEKHKIKREQFVKSMDWYAKHPELLKKIYENVIIELSKKQSEVTSKK